MGTGDAIDQQISELERLLHRRRGWAWTGVAGLMATIVYAIIDANLFIKFIGFAATFTFIIWLALLVLTVIALVLALADTVRLRRAPAAARASAAAGTSHHPWHVHLSRYPPHHKSSWYTGWALIAVAVIPVVVCLPSQVNGIAYLAGAGSRSVFHPVGYTKVCGRRGCSTVTDGFLPPTSTGGGRTSVTWPGAVPLNEPLTVRTPVWSWGQGRSLMTGDSAAVKILILGLILELAGVGVFFVAIRTIGEAKRERRGAIASVATVRQHRHPRDRRDIRHDRKASR